ncbi:MAG: tRNA pseudouridine(55) synthase TruB [Pirellulales bacterium]
MSALGLLSIHKPPGISSRRVVDHVQRLVRPAKAGHAGTLDPLAEGVLVVCVGSATRLIEYVQRMPKRYRGTFLLGRTSASDDIETEVELLDDPPQPTREEIAAAAGNFVGDIQQRPPAFSAVKVRGHRAYALARAGKPVEPAPRTVTVYSLDPLRYDYPELELDIRCGQGTYVRALGRDMAELLGTGAVMSALVRTAVGAFTLDNAVTMESVHAETLPELLLPARRAVEELPAFTMDEMQLERIARGQSIEYDAAHGVDEFAGIDASGKLVAILRPRGGSLWHPVRNFASAG